MLKKTVNLVALMMLVSTNVLSPFSYAGEIGAVSEETIDANLQTENFYETQSGNTQDSSVKSQNDEKDSQNDGIVVPLGERGYGEAEGIYSGEEEKILSPSDSPSGAGQASFQKGAQEEVTQNSQQFTQLDGVEGAPLDVQDDEGEIENDEQKDSDLEDMPKILADEISPIDMLTLELEKSEQPQVQDVSTVIDYYPDSNVRYTLNGNENFTAGTITITDGTDTITILDRNLGATAAGTGCHYKTNGKTYCSYDDTYGYHFQWGNNHGFKPGCDLSGSIKSCSDSTTLNAVSGQVDATTISYNPANQEYYNSGVFYKGSGDWLNDSNKVNLWGGSTGDSTTFVEFTEEQAKLRQGPCPKGFHVPSVGELVKLSSMMTGSSDSEKDVQLHNLLYIPYAGFRDLVDAYVYDMGYYTFMWSSSPQPSHDGISYYLTLLDGINYYISRGSRADAYSIRCFYDKYETYEVPEVDTTPPAKPEIGCPNNDEIRECVANEEFCPQYDFNKDGIINQSDALLISRGVCTTDNSFINVNNDITNSKNPRFIRNTPGGAEGLEEIGGYEIQICSDSGCNTVIHSGSYEEVVGHTDLEDGTYYWRVRAIDKAGNEGERSDTLSFTVDTTPPVKPEIGCPDVDEVTQCSTFGTCPQYDIDSNGEVDINEIVSFASGICTTDNTFINVDNDITNSKNPKLIRKTPGGAEGAEEIGGYEVQICSDSGCNNVLYSGTYEEIIQNELSDGEYYWRVKASDDLGNRGEWSDIWSFRIDTIAPVKPEIGFPTTGEVYNCVVMGKESCPQYDFNKDGRVTISDYSMLFAGVPLSDNTYINENNDITNSKNPRFIRSTPGGAEGVEEIGGYEMQICSDSGCNNVIHSGSYEEIIQNELLDGKYYWRVKAIDKAGNEGERSDTLSFTVDTTLPAKPEIGCPDADEVLRSVTMRVYSPQYDFDLNGRLNANDAALVLKGICTSGDNDIFIKSDGAVTRNKTPRLVRSTPGGVEGGSEIGGYEVQICSDSECNNVAYSGSYEEIIQNELLDGKYYWRVKAIDKAGNEGERSDTLSFTVDTEVPSKPEMGVPTTGEIYNCILDDQYCPQYDFDKNGRVTTADLNMFQSGVLLSDNTFIKENEDITNSKNPRLVRKTPGGSEGGSEIGGYEIQICRDSGCNNVIHSGSYEDVVGHTDLDDGKYYWRVKAIDKAGNEGEWSDILSFTVTGDEEKKSGGSSGGGGRSSKTSDIHPISSQNDNSVSSGAIAKDLRGDTQDSSNKSSEQQEILSFSDSHNSAGQVSFTNDQKEAYEFAKSNGITTTSSIEKAKMNTTLTRIQMAKMLSNFAINVMKQEPDVSKGIIKFNDVTNKMNKQYDYAVTKAYQLGIMGQNVKSNNFRPNDEVTRAEFATALSRLLYNTSDGEYKSTSRYYIPHIKKLMQKGIITKDDPKMKEKRGYVMIMLMRSVK